MEWYQYRHLVSIKKAAPVVRGILYILDPLVFGFIILYLVY